MIWNKFRIEGLFKVYQCNLILDYALYPTLVVGDLVNVYLSYASAAVKACD